jgi:hypothetical protein
MLFLITCGDLEVVTRRRTTAIKLVLAHVFVSGSTSLVHQLVRNRVFHRRDAAPTQGSGLWLQLFTGAP